MSSPTTSELNANLHIRLKLNYRCENLKPLRDYIKTGIWTVLLTELNNNLQKALRVLLARLFVYIKGEAPLFSYVRYRLCSAE